MRPCDHVVLRAADPTKLERFYLDALGLTFEKRQGELAQLRAGNAREWTWQRSLGMPKKRFSAEQIVVLLRQIEVLMSRGKAAP
jgi:hypothetical protein